MDTFPLTLTGPPRLASALAQMLKAEGAQVRYSPPVERRSVVDAAQEVVVQLTVNGVTASVAAAIYRFRSRWPGVNVAGGPERSIVERLQELQDLHDDGVISDAELAEHRSRVIGEV